MKILFAGKFDPCYNRTKVIIDGLKTIKQIDLAFFNYNDNKFNIKKLTCTCKEADLIFLPSFTHLNVPLIKILSDKPVIFDPLISRYLTKVLDYKTVGKYTPRALKNFLKDKISMNMADVVLCDTLAHKNYYHSVIGIPYHKLKVLPVGVNIEECQSCCTFKSNEDTFVVGFYGSFVPLHGTKLIIETAKLLQNEPIQFQVIGEGFEYEEVRHLAINTYKLKNTIFSGWLKHKELLNKVNSFDLCLGIFGNTLKADLVIPNKIYHYAAFEKAIITKETAAIKGVFEDNVNILLTENKPEAIAEKILRLKNDPLLRSLIARNSYEKVAKEYNHLKIAGKLITIVEELLNQKKKQ